MFYVEAATANPLPEALIPPTSWITARRSKESLALLRLVNKAFCHSASARLFRNMVALVDQSCHTTKLPSLSRLMSLVASPYAQYLQQLDIGYTEYSYSKADVEIYMEVLSNLLSSFLWRLPNLKTISFNCPRTPNLFYESSRAGIDSILRSLRYVPLPNLSELELRLPMTSHFTSLFGPNISPMRIPIQHTLQRLRYLGLRVNGQTNQQDFATYLFKMVEASTSLVSLSISSMDNLSVDGLELAPNVRLRCFSLCKVRISYSTLVQILEQNRESMKKVELKDIRMGAGFLREVLSIEGILPHLPEFELSLGRFQASSQNSSTMAGNLSDSQTDISRVNTLDLLGAFVA
ncbi:hypothetical protein PENSTE_c001G00640 [Penicillium steckii]|uniref:F-box domain-containing protein n=1 Tax=Penicillium steckii TaxID=303698 RepID=A0A1V6TYN4_9EURO|nr:hypothetical protein PENSTE_c001G00640 [Penicillium steckii]